jgi:hypothetical protein
LKGNKKEERRRENSSQKAKISAKRAKIRATKGKAYKLVFSGKGKKCQFQRGSGENMVTGPT